MSHSLSERHVLESSRNLNVKFELPRAFKIYQTIFQFVCAETDDISQLIKDFVDAQSYKISNTVEPFL